MVLDASALLALLLGEPGAKTVQAAIDGAVLSAVNLAEIVSHYARLGADQDDIESMLKLLAVRVVPIDAQLSVDAGMLRRLPLEGGLSLGDCYCLALARRQGVTALTADRRWPRIASAARVTVKLIR